LSGALAARNEPPPLISEDAALVQSRSNATLTSLDALQRVDRSCHKEDMRRAPCRRQPGACAAY